MPPSNDLKVSLLLICMLPLWKKLISDHRNFVRMPVWLGACCVLTLLGTSLFTHNVITTTTMDIANTEGGSVNILQSYRRSSRGLSGSALGDQGPTLPIASYGAIGFAFPANVIQDYSSSPDDDLSLHGKAHCDTMNCTFEPYENLRICAHCEDVSKEIYVESGRSLLRSGVLSLDAEKGFVNITSDMDYPRWDWLSEDAPVPLLVHYLALAQAGVKDQDPIAVECAAYWCVTTYKSRMSHGTLDETPWGATPSGGGYGYDPNEHTFTNRSTSARTHHGQNNSIYIRPDTCQFNGSTFNDSRNCTFHVGAASQNGLQNFLTEGYYGGIPPLLKGSAERVNSSSNASWSITSLAANAIVGACSETAGDAKCQPLLHDTIATAFTNLTAFMSNVLRKSGPSGPAFVYGMSHELRQVYHIRCDSHASGAKGVCN